MNDNKNIGFLLVQPSCLMFNIEHTFIIPFTKWMYNLQN